MTDRISLAQARPLRQWSTEGTPLPWAVEDEHGDQYVISSPSANAEIARVEHYQDGEADASYLVRAANAVPAMADTIEALADQVTSMRTTITRYFVTMAAENAAWLVVKRIGKRAHEFSELVVAEGALDVRKAEHREAHAALIALTEAR